MLPLNVHRPIQFPSWYDGATNTKSKFLNLAASTWTNLWKYLRPIEWATMINESPVRALIVGSPF